LLACEQAIWLDPTYVNGYVNKAIIFSHFKRRDKAVEAIEQALQLDPNSARAYSGKVFVLMNLRRYEEALVICERAIQLDPMSVGNYMYKVQIFYRLKRYDKAMEVSKQIIQLDPANKYMRKYLNSLKHYRASHNIWMAWISYNIIIAFASILAMGVLGFSLGSLFSLVIPLLVIGALLILIIPQLFLMRKKTVGEVKE
jgi:tetratricopeptide (TPR) repeat protein